MHCSSSLNASVIGIQQVWLGAVLVGQKNGADGRAIRWRVTRTPRPRWHGPPRGRNRTKRRPSGRYARGYVPPKGPQARALGRSAARELPGLTAREAAGWLAGRMPAAARRPPASTAQARPPGQAAANFGTKRHSGQASAAHVRTAGLAPAATGCSSCTKEVAREAAAGPLTCAP